MVARKSVAGKNPYPAPFTAWNTTKDYEPPTESQVGKGRVFTFPDAAVWHRKNGHTGEIRPERFVTTASLKRSKKPPEE
jgi:hypothetical protein